MVLAALSAKRKQNLDSGTGCAAGHCRGTREPAAVTLLGKGAQKPVCSSALPPLSHEDSKC